MIYIYMYFNMVAKLVPLTSGTLRRAVLAIVVTAATLVAGLVSATRGFVLSAGPGLYLLLSNGNAPSTISLRAGGAWI